MTRVIPPLSLLPDTVVRVVDAVCVAPEPLPGEPSHGRRDREAVVQARRRLPLEPHEEQKDGKVGV